MLMTSKPETVECVIEQFWFNLKSSMNNFYKKYRSVKRPLSHWDATIKLHYSKGDFEKIVTHIQSYMTMYSLDIMRSNDQYDTNILSTNFKRFDKICQNMELNSLINKKKINTIDTIFCIYETLIKKGKITSEVSNKIFQQVEMFVFDDIYDDLIIYAVTNNMPSVLTKLKNITNVSEFINSYYNLNIDNKMNGNKIIKLIKLKFD